MDEFEKVFEQAKQIVAIGDPVALRNFLAAHREILTGFSLADLANRSARTSRGVSPLAPAISRGGLEGLE